MYRTFSPSRFDHVKTPKTETRKFIEAIIDNPTSLIREVNKSPKTVRNDPSLVVDLRSQLTRAATQNLDITQRFNLLEHNKQKLEVKNARLQEEVKLTREIDNEKDKELNNLQVQINYLLHEKHEMEKKMEDDKKYIFKLERKLLEWAKKKGIKSLKDISLDRGEWSKFGTSKQFDYGSIPQYEAYGKSGKDPETIIAEQAYEIKVLRAALENRAHDAQLDGIGKESLQKESEEIRQRFAELKKETEALSQENRMLLVDNQVLKEKLKEHLEQETVQKTETRRKEQEASDFQNEVRIWKKKHDTLEAENQSLADFIEDLKQKLRALEEENISLTSTLKDVKKEIQTKEAVGVFEIESKDTQIKLLREQLAQEKQRTTNLNQRLKENNFQSELLNKDENTFAKIEYVNNQLLKEVNTLKNLIEEQYKENDYYKQLNQQLVKEKDQLREAVQTFIDKNAVLENNFNTFTNQAPISGFSNGAKPNYLSGIDSLEKFEFEKHKLRQALNEAINVCSAYTVKDRDKNKLLQEKDKRIMNLTEKKLGQEQVLGDQLLVMKGRNEKLADDYRNAQDKLQTLKTENEHLRSVIRAYERRTLDKPTTPSMRFNPIRVEP